GLIGVDWSALWSGPRRLAAGGFTVGEQVAVGSAAAAGLAVVATAALASLDTDEPRYLDPERRVRGNTAVTTITLATFGVYFCLPETDTIAVLVGPVLVGAVMTLGLFFAPPGSTAIVLWGAAVAWIVIVGGQGRPASMVGAAGCVVLVVPGLVVATDVLRRPATWVGAVLTVAGCSRVAGIQTSVVIATGVTVLVWGLYGFFMVPVFRSVAAEKEFGSGLDSRGRNGPGSRGRNGPAGSAWGR
ncbi:MAG: hypothetical protein ACK5PP_07200, partial [Acidimicrobiales bacterium]